MIHSFITHNRTSVCKASRHECNMSAQLRKSAGSDIKRLQEMVKRLEEQNAQLKSTDSRRVPSNRINDDNMVKVKLNLDDVPLLDLNAMVEEDEDTWWVTLVIFAFFTLGGFSNNFIITYPWTNPSLVSSFEMFFQ